MAEVVVAALSTQRGGGGEVVGSMTAGVVAAFSSWRIFFESPKSVPCDPQPVSLFPHI